MHAQGAGGFPPARGGSQRTHYAWQTAVAARCMQHELIHAERRTGQKKVHEQMGGDGDGGRDISREYGSMRVC